ncbi:MAG: TATA-box-binding protein [Candidatus Aenigmatarchaeota archaeon]|nr:MAG: TATA-box-binding protein [Candidatus Aenigmarchaeota archaeon]
MAEEIKIENVVASASLNVKIDLSKLLTLPGTEYEPEQFPGLVLRMRDPKAAALIFSSGKIVCTGAKSPELARKAIDNVIKNIRSVGIKVKKAANVTIENIVASTKLDQELKLNEIAFALPNAEYEPEQFPGLVYRMDDPKVAFLLFGSGKVVCTGGKSIEDIKRAIDKVEKKLAKL